MTKKTLVKSTSGVRGIIGAGLDPVLAAQYAAAFGTMLGKGTVVVGRDSRPSGPMLTQAVVAGLTAVGLKVIEIGIVPTPTVEIAVKKLKAVGGMCITASHNPAPWNALKFFNRTGEFITPAEYKKLSRILDRGEFAYVPVERLGTVAHQDGWIDQHIRMTLAAKGVKVTAVKHRRFKVVIDAVNGAGSKALPALMRRMGATAVELNCKADGDFVHNPEPTPKNLTQLGRAVRRHKADLGLACDPDADRLALVDNTGTPISEELTLSVAVKQVLRHRKGSVVVNLSTSRATVDVARAAGSRVYLSKVGEANVVQEMRKRRAVVGGEGNGGVIYPAFHAGRDSLIAAALVLSCLAEDRKSLRDLVGTLPKYYIIKDKAELPRDFAKRLKRFEKEAGSLLGKIKTDRRDGLRFDFARGWVQIRTSNTEPIFRLIVETSDPRLSDDLLRRVMKFFK